jgi:hypothetical protein
VHRRRLAVVALSLIGLGTLVAGAAGAGLAGRPPGSPDLATMALAVTDLPVGTRIDSQGYHRDPDYVASYERDFDIRGGRIGRSRLLAAFESLDVDRTPASAKSTFDLIRALFGGKQGASLLKLALADEGVDPDNIKVGRIRQPKIGHGALVIPMRVKSSGVTFELTITFMRLDRVLVTMGLVAMPGSRLAPRDVDRVSGVAIDRARGGLVPRAVSPPSISGITQPGQVLTATRGTWTGDQLQFAGWQWSRCGGAGGLSGGTCTPIPGATSSTYTVTPGDLASTLVVSVLAKNRLGTLEAPSEPSPVVAGPTGSPTNTALPVISGAATTGSALNVSTGSWAGDPSAFTYQWRRCKPNVPDACSDIAGATGETYVVAATDSLTVLRVLVVAANSYGQGGAVSAPTMQIP